MKRLLIVACTLLLAGCAPSATSPSLPPSPEQVALDERSALDPATLTLTPQAGYQLLEFRVGGLAATAFTLDLRGEGLRVRAPFCKPHPANKAWLLCEAPTLAAGGEIYLPIAGEIASVEARYRRGDGLAYRKTWTPPQ